MDCSPPGSSVHGILQARILQLVAISFFRGSSWPRVWTLVSCTAGWSLPSEPSSVLKAMNQIIKQMQFYFKHHLSTFLLLASLLFLGFLHLPASQDFGTTVTFPTKQKVYPGRGSNEQVQNLVWINYCYPGYELLYLIVENRLDFEKGNVPRTPEIIPHTGVTTLPTNTSLVM